MILLHWFKRHKMAREYMPLAGHFRITCECGKRWYS